MVPENLINIFDILFAFVVIAIAVIYLYWKKHTTYQNSTVKRYIIPAFILKIAGWVFSIALAVSYFDGRVDTLTTYFRGVSFFREAFAYDFINIIKYCFFELSTETIRENNIPSYFLHSSGTGLVIRIGLLLSYLCFGRFLILSLLCTILGFLGTWKIYTFFCRIQPALHKEFALSFLFLPSLIFWGSGLMKESFVFLALPFIFVGFFEIFIKGRFKIYNLISLIFGSWLLLSVKTYIFLSIAPALLIWATFERIGKIKDYKLRIFLLPIIISFLLGGFFSTTSIVAAKSKELAMDNLKENMESRVDWWKKNDHHGSSYSLPTIDFSPKGIVTAIPSLYLTGLLRPYIWESRKPIILVSAIETFILLLFVMFVFVKTGILKTLKKIFFTPMYAGIFIFSLIFFPVVALTSGNFGTLVRYKLPCLPFFIAMLFQINFEYKLRKRQKKLLKDA